MVEEGGLSCRQKGGECCCCTIIMGWGGGSGVRGRPGGGWGVGGGRSWDHIYDLKVLSGTDLTFSFFRTRSVYGFF